MWTSTDKTFNDCPMFFQFSRENEFFVISFTNLKQYFSTKINNTAFTSSINSLNNTNLEISENDLIHFLESISTEEMKNVNFNFHSKELNIKADIIITLTKGFPPLKLEFELDLMDNNFFYSNFTCPLLELVQVLKNNQNKLFDIIKKKDLEIAEYILEGGNITQKNILTEPFEKNNFLISTLQNYKDASDQNLNLHKLFLSPLTQQFNKRYTYPIENKELNQSVELKSTIPQKSPTKIKYTNRIPSTSTAIEITNASINVKKKKTDSVLRNL